MDIYYSKIILILITVLYVIYELIFLKTTRREEFNGISDACPNFEKNDPAARHDSGPAGPHSSES